MAQTAHSLVPVNTKSLMSIDPQKNWRRYPSVPITADMVTPAYVPVITYFGGVVDEGADGDNNGETGTINTTGPDFAPKTQAAKAALPNLTPDTIIAPDVGKSYGTKARGDIEPFAAYTVAAGKPTSDDIPDAFKPAALVIPEPAP